RFSSTRPPVFNRSLWQPTQYLSMSALVSTFAVAFAGAAGEATRGVASGALECTQPTAPTITAADSARLTRLETTDALNISCLRSRSRPARLVRSELQGAHFSRKYRRFQLRYYPFRFET